MECTCQITTWGNRVAADQGGLRDYAHKEWNGILKDFYFMRWKAYFDYLACVLDGKQPEELDFYTLEEAWTKETGNKIEDSSATSDETFKSRVITEL